MFSALEMKRVSHIVNITAEAITTVHTVKTSQSRAAPVLLQFIVETLTAKSAMRGVLRNYSRIVFGRG